jgi:hypothetical protein
VFFHSFRFLRYLAGVCCCVPKLIHLVLSHSQVHAGRRVRHLIAGDQMSLLSLKQLETAGAIFKLLIHCSCITSGSPLIVDALLQFNYTNKRCDIYQKLSVKQAIGVQITSTFQFLIHHCLSLTMRSGSSSCERTQKQFGR